jgi:hypothetical protein
VISGTAKRKDVGEIGHQTGLAEIDKAEKDEPSSGCQVR